MSYRALYRVWRPQRFDELIGQPVITQTLKNALITGQISHAYLFAGPRGTGKTSAAKIFAKAVNCPNLKDGEPCNHCPICKAITKGKLNDVIEIDAASNNGVDEIRNVRDKVKYAPAQAKYKVYIIDEVHMLSTGAFNALLKTLEEPPSHVIFIMATTEPQKIPATIISRTQRFNFRRIQPKDILKRMEFILNHDKVHYDDQALKVIAKAAEGGMRDALSILDEVMSYGKDNVTYQNALQVTGSVTKGLLYKYLKEVYSHNVRSALIDVQKILDAGKDANQFTEELIDYCQDLLLYQQSPQMVLKRELGIVNDKFKVFAKRISPNLIYAIIEQLNDIQEQMRFTVHPDVYLEVLTVKIATLKIHDSMGSDAENDDEKKIKVLSGQVSQLQDEVDKLKGNENVAKASNPQSKPRMPGKDKTSSAESFHVDLGQMDPILNHATRSALNKMQGAWNQVIDSLPVNERAIMQTSKPVAASSNGIVVSFSYGFFCRDASNDHKLIKFLKNGLDQMLGILPKIVFVSDAKWARIRSDYYKKHTTSITTSKSASQSISSQRPKPASKSASDGDHKNDKKSEANDASNSADNHAIIKKASKLLGKDAVKILKIKND